MLAQFLRLSGVWHERDTYLHAGPSGFTGLQGLKNH